MRELQQRLTSAEFAELWAFKRRNTFQPDVWRAAATAASYQVCAQTGVWIPPETMIPTGTVDVAKLRRDAEAAAERRLDRAAEQDR